MAASAASASVSAHDSAIARKTQALLFKTKLCVFYKKGTCTKGEACGFAHTRDQQRTKPELYRTKMCPDVEQYGECTRERCRYAHKDGEMRYVRGSRLSDNPQGVAAGSYPNTEEYAHALQTNVTDVGPSLVTEATSDTTESTRSKEETRPVSATDSAIPHARRPRLATTEAIRDSTKSEQSKAAEAPSDSVAAAADSAIQQKPKRVLAPEVSPLPTLLHRRIGLTTKEEGQQCSVKDSDSDGVEDVHEVVMCNKNTFVTLEPAMDPFMQMRRTRTEPSRA